MPATKPVILVVDDDAILRLYASDVLEELGYAIEEADSAETAIAMLEQHAEIRLIVTDIQMPGAYDGIELARRAQMRWPHIGVVITSGRQQPTEAEIPDAAHFMANPYSAHQLMAHVSDLLRVE